MGKRSRSRQQTPAAGGAADGLESPQENFFGSRLALALVLLCALAAVWPALIAAEKIVCFELVRRYSITSREPAT